MKFFIMIAALFAITAHAAGPWKIEVQNIKLPSQAMLEHYTWASPAAASATAMVNAGAAANGAATTFSTFVAQPDVPRNIVITTGGTTANVGAGTAVVTGKNIFGQTITENFAISGAQNGATTGNKAFKSVSSVSFPATTGPNVTVSIGTGTKLGVSHCSDQAGDYVFSEFGGAYEATRGTFAAAASDVSSNTFIPNGSPNGATSVELYYVQNYRCY